MPKAVNSEDSEVLVQNVEIHSTMLARMLGLMGRPSLAHDQAVLIERCNWIHTAFMRFPIDAVFLDRTKTVVRVIRNIAPWSMPPPVWKAAHTLEGPVGFADRAGLRPGLKITFVD